MQRDAISQPSASGNRLVVRSKQRRQNRRRAASSPGRTRDGRHARQDRSASCCPPVSTRRLPAQRSPCSRAGGSSAAPNSSRRVASRSSASIAVGGSASASRARRASGSSRLARVELGPRSARFVRQTATARGAPIFSSEERCAGAMQPSEADAEFAFGRPTRRALIDPLEHQVIRYVVGHRQYLGHRNGVRVRAATRDRPPRS